MEVHHHAHSSRKKWTHYFWEFLMLFLAVFCGFLAEYQLEHKIEKDRERQYMQSLVEDLQIDTATLQDVYELGTQQIIFADSLLEAINDHPLNPAGIARLYLLSSNSTRVVTVGFETRTSSQLKNAGAMRLVRKKIVADSILGYWQYVQTCQDISSRLDQLAGERGNISVRLFHHKYLIREHGLVSRVTGVKPGAVLISNDPVLLAEYSNRTYSRRLVLTNYLAVMKWTQDRATRLIEIIRNKYHLK